MFSQMFSQFWPIFKMLRLSHRLSAKILEETETSIVPVFFLFDRSPGLTFSHDRLLESYKAPLSPHFEGLPHFI